MNFGKEKNIRFNEEVVFYRRTVNGKATNFAELIATVLVRYSKDFA